MAEIKFKRDTAFRKQFFVPDSFAHPAKMDAQLLIWIVEHYTKVGETILDPMAGSGTTMLACTLGRNVILVELEEKFIKMCRDNWELVRMRPHLGYPMGNCRIMQGDARQLDRLLVDKCIFSPPYAQNTATINGTEKFWRERKRKWGNRTASPRRRQIDSQDYGNNPSNIANLPYGEIDKIVTSPPYSETGVGDWKTGRAEFQRWVLTELETKGYVEWQGKRYTESEWRALNHGRIDGRTTKGVHKHPTDGYSDNPANIGNLPHGDIDKIITSPPYEGSEARDRSSEGWWNERRELEKAGGSAKIAKGYQADKDNIGSLKSQSYLEAMLQVYQQCHRVLKPNGLMVLVTKNFIRNKKVVRLDLDTIKLCEHAGFEFIERHYRKLPAQSFWRIIYYQKHPDVERINHEDILVFRK